MRIFSFFILLLAISSSCKPSYQESSAPEEHLYLFKDLNPSEVTQITITSPYQILNFHLQPDHSWTIAERDDYPADNLAIADLLSSFAEIKILDRLPVSQENLPRLGLAPPTPPSDEINTTEGTRITLKSPTQTYSALIGHLKTSQSEASTMFGAHYDGQRLALLDQDPNHALSINHALKELTTNVAYWIDSRFFTASSVKTLSLIKEDIPSWTLQRSEPEDRFTLAGEKDTLPNLTEFIDYLFFTFRIHDVLPSSESLAKPVAHSYRIETFSGLNFEILIGPLIAVSAEEQAYRDSITGFLRPANITSLRTIQVTSNNAAPHLSKNKLPRLDTPYLVQLPQLNQLILTRPELLLFETRL